MSSSPLEEYINVIVSSFQGLQNEPDFKNAVSSLSDNVDVKYPASICCIGEPIWIHKTDHKDGYVSYKINRKADDFVDSIKNQLVLSSIKSGIFMDIANYPPVYFMTLNDKMFDTNLLAGRTKITIGQFRKYLISYGKEGLLVVNSKWNEEKENGTHQPKVTLHLTVDHYTDRDPSPSSDIKSKIERMFTPDFFEWISNVERKVVVAVKNHSKMSLESILTLIAFETSHHESGEKIAAYKNLNEAKKRTLAEYMKLLCRDLISPVDKSDKTDEFTPKGFFDRDKLFAYIKFEAAVIGAYNTRESITPGNDTTTTTRSSIISGKQHVLSDGDDDDDDDGHAQQLRDIINSMINSDIISNNGLF